MKPKLLPPIASHLLTRPEQNPCAVCGGDSMIKADAGEARQQTLPDGGTCETSRVWYCFRHGLERAQVRR